MSLFADDVAESSLKAFVADFDDAVAAALLEALVSVLADAVAAALSEALVSVLADVAWSKALLPDFAAAASLAVSAMGTTY